MNLFMTSFISLFVIVDPVGNAAVFSGLTAQNTDKESRAIALKATLIAICVLFFFGFLGKIVLTYMGISTDAFKIAGGLLLFYTAFSMVMGGHEETVPDRSRKSSDLAIFPMAIPLMAGPGTATAIILLMDVARTENEPVLYVVLAMLLVELIGLILLIGATRVKKFLGAGTLSVFARIMGVLLAALSVQFVIDGLHIVQ